MANVATIQAYAGPGRLVETQIPLVQEITLRFKKKVIEILNEAGEMGHFDLAQVATLSISTEDGENYTVNITAKVEESNELRARDDERSKLGFIEPESPSESDSESEFDDSGVTQGDGFTDTKPIVKNGRVVG